MTPPLHLTMKPEQIRSAIAEAVGWTLHPGNEMLMARDTWTREDGSWDYEIPDFCNSLDAIHEAVCYLRNSDRMAYLMYANRLEKIVAVDNSKPENEAYHGWMTCDATAAQRCEAFLRTLGLWIEGGEA